MKNTVKNTLRWIALIPAAYGGGVAGSAAVFFAAYLALKYWSHFGQETSMYLGIIVGGLSLAVGGLAIAHFIAPKGKMTTVATLAIINTIYALFGMLGSWGDSAFIFVFWGLFIVATWGGWYYIRIKLDPVANQNTNAQQEA